MQAQLREEHERIAAAQRFPEGVVLGLTPQRYFLLSVHFELARLAAGTTTDTCLLRSLVATRKHVRVRRHTFKLASNNFEILYQF